MPDLKERTAEAARIVKSNPERDAAVRQFRLRWGMPETEAQHLYEAVAMPGARGGWLIKGLRSIGAHIFLHFAGQVVFAILLVIFGVLFALLFPGSSGKVVWIVTILAIWLFFLAVLLWGSFSARRKNPTAAHKSPVKLVLMASPLLLIGLVSVVLVAMSDTPENSDLDWRDDVPEEVDETNWIFSGELVNNSAGYRVVNLELDLVFYDGEENLMGDGKLELTGITVEPGQTQSYIRRMEVPEGAEKYRWNGEWEWQKVE